MNHEKKGKNFIKQPKFVGGPTALKKLVVKELKYPKEALEQKIEGTVKVAFTVNHKGKVIETKVLSKLGHGCDQEAERIVKLFKYDIPKNRGVKVLFHKQIGINFRLPKVPVVPKKKIANDQPAEAVTSGINYHYVPSKGKKKGYNYTVNI